VENATNKIIKRQLTAQATRIPHGALWRGDPRGGGYQEAAAPAD